MKEFKIQKLIDIMEDKYKLSSNHVVSSLSNLIYMLLAHIKQVDINNLKLSGYIMLTDEEFHLLDKYIDMVCLNMVPPQYIIGNVNIYNENYFVNANVLIPRQDTESLIEEVIKIINENSYISMLDICSGSGVIGVSVANNSNIQNVTMADISDGATEVANINIIKNKASDKCHTIVSNMFNNLYEIKNKYDIIVSNPPYLTEQELIDVSDFVKKEPTLALDGGEDGLDFYRLIYNEARSFLNDNGCIAVEIGSKQAKQVTDIIREYEEYVDIQVIKDINLNDRVVICRFQKI